jgi:phage gp29-like protein
MAEMGSVKEDEKLVIGVEVATVEKDWTRSFIGEVLYPEQDTILTELGGYDLRIYERLLRDDRVKVELQKRFDLQKSWEWTIEPASEDAADVALADWWRELIGKLPMDDVTDKMLFGLYYGYSVAELGLVKGDDGWVTLDWIKVKNRRRFKFDKYGNVRLLTRNNLVDGEIMHSSRVWTITYGGYHDDDPYGLGLGYWLYWLVTFKRGGLRHWLDFLERYAKGVPNVEYPDSGDKEKSKAEALKLAKALYDGKPSASTAGTVARFIEQTRSSGADYKTLYDSCNRAISEVIVGQSLTTEQGSSEAQGRVHEEVLEDIVKSDSDVFCESFSNNVIAKVSHWNAPNAKPPKLRRKPKESTDTKVQADTDKLVFDMGYQRTPESILEIYGEGYVAKALTPSPSPNTGRGGLEFAESTIRSNGGINQFAEAIAKAKPDTIDLMVAQLKRKNRAVIEGWIAQLEAELDNSEDLAEYWETVAELYPDLAGDEMVQNVAGALSAASVAGNYESQEGAI